MVSLALKGFTFKRWVAPATGAPAIPEESGAWLPLLSSNCLTTPEEKTVRVNWLSLLLVAPLVKR